MISVTGTRELVAKMRRDIEKLKGSVTATHRQLVQTMFTDLVAHTPQWSGELAMHWGIEVHGAQAPSAYSIHNPAWQVRERENPRDTDPFRMGAEPAVTLTISRELKKIASIRYNSIVKFTNKMPYAEEVERGVGPFGKPIRDVNRLEAYGGVAMIGYLNTKYSNTRLTKKAIR